jgi:hypothetical protein
VIGYRDPAKLSVAIEREIAGDAITSPTREEAATLITAWHRRAKSTTSGTSS